MVDVTEEIKPLDFSFDTVSTGAVQDDPLTSEKIEEKINEVQAPKKRGRKPGSSNKSKEETIDPAMVKMFSPLVIGLHNGILALLKLSAMNETESKMVGDSWGNLLVKKAPEFMSKYGDWLAAGGATALVFMGKLSTETDLFKFKSKEKKQSETLEQYNDNSRSER